MKDDIIFRDDATKAEVLNKYFTSIFTKEYQFGIPTMAGTPYPDILDIKISEVGVAHQLETLNLRKSGGPDEIPPRFLKELANDLAPSLSLIFHFSNICKTGYCSR